MEEDLLLKIAHMYYGLGMTQEKIAKQLFFSRSRISHLLTEAEEKGYVRFEVRPMVYQPINLKNYFFQHFNLHDAIIVAGRYCVGNEIFPRYAGVRRIIWPHSSPMTPCSTYPAGGPCTASYRTSPLTVPFQG